MKRIELIMILMFSLFLISCGSGGSGESGNNSNAITPITTTYQNSTTTFSNNTTTVFSNNTTIFDNITTGGQIIIPDIILDTESPTTPTNLMAIIVSSSEIQLSWNASIDNIGVMGYKIYRNGSYLASVNTIAASNTGLTGETQYCYSVSAYDLAGNESNQASQSCATTSQTPWQTSVSNPNAIVKDNNGNLYVAGAGNNGGDASLEKFDITTGIKKWHIDINSMAEYVAGIASDGSNVYVYWLDNNSNIASDKAKAYVSAYDGNANNLWETEVISDYAFPGSIAADVNNIYISASNNGGSNGNIVKKLDLNGNIVGQVGNTTSDFSAITVYNGYVYCAGHNMGINVVKYDSNLNQIWQTTELITWQETLYADQNYDIVNSIVADATGVYVGGYVWTPADTIDHHFLAVHYNDAGVQLWNVAKSDNGGGSFIEGGAITVDENNIYLAIGNNGTNAVNVIGLSKNDGIEFWRSQNTVNLAYGNPIGTESSVISSGIIFIPDSGINKIVLFDTSTGAQIE